MNSTGRSAPIAIRTRGSPVTPPARLPGRGSGEENSMHAHSRIIRAVGIVAAMLTATGGSLIATATVSGASEQGGVNNPGNVLIADQFNNRVVEVDRDHRVVWHFGNGSSVAGPNSIVGTNDAERVGDLTLIAGTGTPAGADPSCADPNGCADNRVILVNQDGHIVWQYGKAGVTGAGFNELSTPGQATALPSGHGLITDEANERIIEVNREHEIVWQYGMTGMTGAGFNQLNNPNSAQLLANGHIIIAHENNNPDTEPNRS